QRGIEEATDGQLVAYATLQPDYSTTEFKRRVWLICDNGDSDETFIVHRDSIRACVASATPDTWRREGPRPRRSRKRLRAMQRAVQRRQ
ncbi:MAG: hypothetical protein MI741_14855, partial [Rhodospirillales bacterium]|nr:hypothetical protein [Rhodospirillales bacterium]